MSNHTFFGSVVPRSGSPLNRVWQVGPWLFVSGQVSVDMTACRERAGEETK